MQKICLFIITCSISFYSFGQVPDSVQVSVQGKFIGWEKTWYFRLGNKRIPVKITDYGKSPGIVLLSVHDDETTSVKAAENVLENTGGILVRISNNNNRLISFTLKGKKYRFDPNRMFTRTGIRQNLTELNGSYRETALVA